MRCSAIKYPIAVAILLLAITHGSVCDVEERRMTMDRRITMDRTMAEEDQRRTMTEEDQRRTICDKPDTDNRRNYRTVDDDSRRRFVGAEERVRRTIENDGRRRHHQYDRDLNVFQEESYLPDGLWWNVGQSVAVIFVGYQLITKSAKYGRNAFSVGFGTSTAKVA